MTTESSLRTERRTDRTGTRLALAMTALVATDLVGGVWAATSGVNTWAGAWGSKALLAAPLPMIVAQVLATFLAVRFERRWAAVPAVLLSLACLVSVASGFFDGALGNDELTRAMPAFQMFLLAVTATVGVLAALRARRLLQSR